MLKFILHDFSDLIHIYVNQSGLFIHAYDKCIHHIKYCANAPSIWCCLFIIRVEMQRLENSFGGPMPVFLLHFPAQ